MSRRIAEAPPVVHAILTTEKLESGAKRQWDTHGRLLLWVPKRWIDALPRRGEHKGVPVRELPGELDVGKLSAIPVYDGDA